jgi:hypothetical protein
MARKGRIESLSNCTAVHIKTYDISPQSNYFEMSYSKQAKVNVIISKDDRNHKTRNGQIPRSDFPSQSPLDFEEIADIRDALRGRHQTEFQYLTHIVSDSDDRAENCHIFLFFILLLL